MVRTVLLAAVLGAGLLLPAPPASADCAECPRTQASVDGPSRVRSGERATFEVTITGGEGRPEGTVSFRITRDGGTARPSRVREYDGEPVTFRTRALRRPGRYRVTVVFLAAPGTFWKESLGGATLRVRPPVR